MDTTDLVTDLAIASFLELSPDAVALVDGRGCMVAVNDALVQLSGHARDRLVGAKVESLVPERLRTRHVSTRESFTADPSIRPMGLGRNLWLATASGREVAVDIALRPLTTRDGMTFAVVIRDVSAARETQLRLQRADGELRGILEAHQDGIAMLRASFDEEGELADLVFEYVNQSAATTLGVPISALIGRSGWSIEKQMAGPPEGSLLDYARLLETGIPVHHETEWRQPGQTDVTALLEVQAALAGPDRIVVSFRDVLEARRTTARVEEMNAELLAANDAMERAAQFQRDFISSSSHELRTPLTAMTGFAELLVTRWDEMDDEARRGAAEAVLRNASRQLQLVDDLAHAAHLQSGRLDLVTTSVDLDSAFVEALASVAGGEQYEPPAPTGLLVLADEGRLIQILINLISNGLRYGRPPYTFDLAPVGDGRVRIQVADRGRGVPEVFVPHLFDAFAQASRGNRREAKGTGLGLYISRTLATAMGGELSYKARDGGGSCFRLTLPEANSRG